MSGDILVRAKGWARLDLSLSVVSRKREEGGGREEFAAGGGERLGSATARGAGHTQFARRRIGRLCTVLGASCRRVCWACAADRWCCVWWRGMRARKERLDRLHFGGLPD